MYTLEQYHAAENERFKELMTNLFPAKNPMLEAMTYEAVESVLTEYLEKELADYTMPELHVPDKEAVSASTKWRCISAMQKSIRRGFEADAMQEALIVHAADPGYCWQRLIVIVFEDIALGDIWATALTLIAARSKVWRDKQGAEKVLCFIVGLMTRTVKDRTLCDLTCYMMGKTLQVPTYKMLNEANTMELMTIVKEADASMTARMAAAWMIYGTDAMENDKLPQREDNKPLFNEMVMEMSLPSLVKYCIVRGQKACRWAMPLTLIFAWELLEKAGKVDIEVTEFPEPREQVKGYAMETFDKHTQDGKSAIMYFSKACQPVKQMLDELGIVEYNDKVDAIGICLFIDEGALLDRKIVFEGSQKIYDANIVVDYDTHKLDSKTGPIMRQLVAENMDLMNKARRKIVG